MEHVFYEVEENKSPEEQENRVMGYLHAMEKMKEEEKNEK